MILDAFEIDNWAGLKSVRVGGLTPGLNILHGPNGTGKSSIVAAIRAALMDFESATTHRDLKRWLPRSEEGLLPRVCVEFRTEGVRRRITKVFHRTKGEGRLERWGTDGWKLETAAPREAHERCRALAGGRSDEGLHQLLWLTQAEFRLPAGKELGEDLTGRLRAVFGAMQSPVDDAFRRRLRDLLGKWFTDTMRPRATDPAATIAGEMEKARAEQRQFDAEFESVRQALDQRSDIEAQIRGQTDELERRRKLHAGHAEAMERATERIAAHERLRLAVAAAESALRRAEDAMRSRAALAGEVESSAVALREAEEKVTARQVRLAGAERACTDAAARVRALETIETAAAALAKAEESVRVRARLAAEVESATLSLRDAEGRLRDRQGRADEAERACADVASRVAELERAEAERGRAAKQAEELWLDADQWVKLQAEHAAAGKAVTQAVQIEADLAEARRNLAAMVVPNEAGFGVLEGLREEIRTAESQLAAAAMTLILAPDAGAAPARLAVDGGDARPVPAGQPTTTGVRMRAVIEVPGWGRVELARGKDGAGVDKLQVDLAERQRRYAQTLGTYGGDPADPQALPALRRRMVDKAALVRRVDELEAAFRQAAPKGVAALQAVVAGHATRLESLRRTRPQFADRPPDPDGLRSVRQAASDAAAKARNALDSARAELARSEGVRDTARKELSREQSALAGIEGTAREKMRRLEAEPPQVTLDAARESCIAALKTARAGLAVRPGDDERATSAAARAELTRLEAARDAARNDLSREQTALAELRGAAEEKRRRLESEPPVETLEAGRGTCLAALDAARAAEAAGRPSPEDRLARELLDDSRQALDATQKRLLTLETTRGRLMGLLEKAEGLHGRRASAESRVRTLMDDLRREELDRDAHKLLHDLFEEARTTRMNRVVGPVEQRVLGWVRMLGVPRWHDVRFGEDFLPQSLVTVARPAGGAGGAGAVSGSVSSSGSGSGSGTGVVEAGGWDLPVDEESTGTLEQIGLLVRLALGSLLSTPADPAVAVLDDPLTHSDLGRLMRMRMVLKDAVRGAPGLNPPAGPLQVLVFTCRPDWFETADAKVVDLTEAGVLGKLY